MTADSPEKFKVIQVSWASHASQLIAVREPVFVIEQKVKPDFEWDEIDAVAIHLLALAHDEPIGCARIINHRKIGRMAVLKHWRGHGAGQALLQEAIHICLAHGTKAINLTAQTHAITFYQQAGFVEISGVYQDANIPHVDMQLNLN
ncbi:MAG: GNAT family N-acetyltransferase [Methylotenera sp.]|nr:GNAT family N-acetyltransferase [Methylotenera sp.]